MENFYLLFCGSSVLIAGQNHAFSSDMQAIHEGLIGDWS